MNMHNSRQQVYSYVLIGLIVVSVALLLATPNFKIALLVAPAILIGSLLVKQYLYVCFYIILLLIPFSKYRNIDLAGSDFNIQRLIALMIVLVLFFQILASKRSFSILKSKLWYYLLPMLFFNFLSSLFSPYLDTVMTAMADWVAAYLFIALTIFLIDEFGLLHYVPLCVVYSVSLSAFLAVLGVYFNIGVALFTEEGRGTGGAIDPNNLSLMVIFTIPLILKYIIYAKNLPERLRYLMLFAINIMAIFSTDSRGGAFITLMMILITLFYHRKRLIRYFGIAVPLLLISILMIPLIIPDHYVDRLSTLTAENQDRSVNRRTAYIGIAFDAYLKRPILGFGPYAFEDFYSQTREAQIFQRGEEKLGRKAHNTYLEILVGSGSIGFFLFLGAIANALMQLYKAKLVAARFSQETADLFTAYQLSFLSVLLYFFIFSDPYHKFFLLMLALSELISRYVKNNYIDKPIEIKNKLIVPAR